MQGDYRTPATIDVTHGGARVDICRSYNDPQWGRWTDNHEYTHVSRATVARLRMLAQTQGFVFVSNRLHTLAAFGWDLQHDHPHP